MDTVKYIKSLLEEMAAQSGLIKVNFYKTGAGGYAEHDQFLGVKVPILRGLAKEYKHLTFPEIQVLIESAINEERLLALFILILQYQQKALLKESIYQFYIENLQYVNNWNLVDASAHLIIGAHLFKKDKDILLQLAKSSIMWERRIAIVATWYFIRFSHLEWTIKIAHLLLQDKQDLIHKAVGWMLREAGKKDQTILLEFLDENFNLMPRTMLRYAIEKLSLEQREKYLSYKKR